VLNWQGPGGWADGDFTGDGIVAVGDLNVIGINWQKGVPQAARPPRAALAAVTVVDTALSQMEDRRELTSPAASDLTLDLPALKRRDGLIQRRWTRSTARSQRPNDDVVNPRPDSSDEADRIDAIFADLY
jgi:hypothetical protein